MRGKLTPVHHISGLNYWFQVEEYLKPLFAKSISPIVAGPRPRCPLPLAPGGALLALRDVGVDVRVELVGAPLQRVSLLALLLGLGLALLRCEMLLLRMGGRPGGSGFWQRRADNTR